MAEVEVEYQELDLVHHLILLELEDSVVEVKVIKLMEFQAIPETFLEMPLDQAELVLLVQSLDHL